MDFGASPHLRRSNRHSNVLLTINDHGIILSANYECAEMFGYQATEIIGRNVSILMPPAYSHSHDTHLERWRRTRVPHIIGSSRVVEGLHKTGYVFPVRLSVSQVDLGEETNFVGLLEKVEDSAARLTINSQGIVQSVNSRAVQLFGYDAHELVGFNVNKIMPENYAKNHDKYIAKYLETGTAKAVGKLRNVEGMNKGGLVFPISLRVSELKGNAELGARQFAAEIHELDQQDIDAVLTMSIDGKIRSCNKNCMLLFGQKEVIGHDITTLLPAFDIQTQLQNSGMFLVHACHGDGSTFKMSSELSTFTVADETLVQLRAWRPKGFNTTLGTERNKSKPLAGTASVASIGQYVGNYRIGKILGMGTFGAVVRATHRLTNKVVAIKIISHESKNSTMDREIQILKHCDHHNIAKLYEIISAPKHTFLVMEYLSGGELFDYVCDNGVYGLSENEARKYFRDVCSAVAYLHSRNIVHRDLKLENLLLDNEGHIKLIDFGLSNFMSKPERMNTLCGSPMYMSPEMYIGGQYDGPEQDIWSLGVILYVLVVGRFPFDSPESIMMGRYQVPEGISVACEDLMEGMLRTDVTERSTMQEILMHSWVNKGLDPIQTPNAPAKEGEIKVDPDVVAEMAAAGFPAAITLASLRNRSFNQITAMYEFTREEKWRVRREKGEALESRIIPMDTSDHILDSYMERARLGNKQEVTCPVCNHRFRASFMKKIRNQTSFTEERSPKHAHIDRGSVSNSTGTNGDAMDADG
eukprot:Clim_evm1s2 gene=Clim_evmTU1s2